MSLRSLLSRFILKAPARSSTGRRKCISATATLFICLATFLQPLPSVAQRLTSVTIIDNPGHPANRFVPSQTLGAGVDGHGLGETLRQLSPANIQRMLTAGFKPLTYRLRTELAGEGWHWNPQGKWSDQAHHQGYWTSDSTLAEPIQVSYGYRLPRRGNTGDQANDDSYSRIDDGRTETFWKSNPYLDQYFTHEQNAVHPQWVMIDLGSWKQINAIQVAWGNPFATKYSIEYGRFVGPEDLSQRLPTVWQAFPRGNIENGNGGTPLIRLATRSLLVRYVRLRLDESAARPSRASTDIRDRLGFAIREIYLGRIDDRGGFHDLIRHGNAHHRQTTIYVSSTDPWHREIDRDDNAEQPGFDFIFGSGLTNGLPMMAPVPVLYDTPANAAAEIKYLTARNYPIDRIEMGEEPDGQFVTPEHYAQLFLQFVEALRRENPRLHYGGPSLQDIEQTEVPGRIEFGKGGWLERFLRYLSDHRRLNDFSFFSFEWYPFENDCDPPGQQLQDAATGLSDALNELQAGGLSKDIPWVISEYGYSAFGARAEIDIEGALLNEDSVGRFLTLGGDAAYLYGYEAGEAIKENGCSAGNNMLFFRANNNDFGRPTAAYWGARLLTQEWVKPGDEIHEIYPAVSDLKNALGQEIITAYALKRPDDLWSLMLINKDPTRAHSVNVAFRNVSGAVSNFTGVIDLFQFSGEQYQLNSDQDNPQPIKTDPPVHTTRQDSSALELPPYSLTIVRGARAP